MSIQSLHQLFSLEGRVAVVTGGSRGLGLQLAEAFGEFGARIALAARGARELEETREHLAKAGIDASCFVCDLSSTAGIAGLVDVLGRTYDRVDILVNNAGANWAAPTAEHGLDAWQKLLNVNLTGPFLLTQAVAKTWMLPARKGRILNMSSVSGLLGAHPSLTGTVAYNTTKGGLISFTRALAAEWGPYGITVNALAPGIFRSKMTKGFLAQHEADVVTQTPRGQLGGPEDLKGAALLFASDAGAHITGQVLTVDGGFSAI